jgi:hypothetical protein
MYGTSESRRETQVNVYKFVLDSSLAMQAILEFIHHFTLAGLLLHREVKGPRAHNILL